MNIKPTQTSALDQIAKVFTDLGSAIGKVAKAVSNFSFTGNSVGGNSKTAGEIKTKAGALSQDDNDAQACTNAKNRLTDTLNSPFGGERKISSIKYQLGQIKENYPELLEDPDVKAILEKYPLDLPKIKEKTIAVTPQDLHEKLQSAKSITIQIQTGDRYEFKAEGRAGYSLKLNGAELVSYTHTGGPRSDANELFETLDKLTPQAKKIINLLNRD